MNTPKSEHPTASRSPTGSQPGIHPEHARGPQPGYHLAARYSIIAALVCFAGNCVANQIAWRQGLSGANWFRVTVNVATAALVVSGVLAGIYGLVVALRRKASDSAGIAVIGLGLQLGIIALTIWGLWMVTKARRELERQSEQGRQPAVGQESPVKQTSRAWPTSPVMSASRVPRASATSIMRLTTIAGSEASRAGRLRSVASRPDEQTR